MNIADTFHAACLWTKDGVTYTIATKGDIFTNTALQDFASCVVNG
jgi:hypothetical protein